MGFTRRDVEAAEDAHSSQPSRLLLSLAQLALSSAEGVDAIYFSSGRACSLT